MEQFAHYYTPAVMSLAVVVAVVPPLLGGSWASWFYQAARAARDRLSMRVGHIDAGEHRRGPGGRRAERRSGQRGRVRGNPQSPEGDRPGQDGDLDGGTARGDSPCALSGHDERELLQIATAIELRSEHPLAQAIVRHAAERAIRPAPVENYQAVKGKGATAMLDGRPVWVGSHRYLEERGHESPEMHRLLEELSAGGSSVVVVGEDGHVCGLIALADRLRPNAGQSVRELKAAGVEHVIMLTGDNQPTAEVIARQCGVDEFRAELLPQDKVAAMEDLVRRYGAVGMVGDGVNDAPALARSSLGIAMGAAGTAAMETADIALMSDDLSRLPWLVHYSRRVLRVIRQNIFASLAVKALFVLLTFLGYASLWAAIAADMGMSLLVVFNSLRLLHGNPTGNTIISA